MISNLEFNTDFLRNLDILNDIDSKIPKINKVFAYGTCGFRYNENELDKVSFRSAILTSFRSKFLEGLPIGIMITASHNKYTDNGIKIIDEHGEYFSRDIEKDYENFINANDIYMLKSIIEEWSKVAKTKHFYRDNFSYVTIGHDTRRSAKNLKSHMIKAFEILGSSYHDYGFVTTPQLHWLTLIDQINFKNKNPNVKFEYSNEGLYWKWLEYGHEVFYEMCSKYNLGLEKADRYERDLLIDCSSGVASLKSNFLNNIFLKRNNLNLKFINEDINKIELLNDQCGAEHINKKMTYPLNYVKGSKKSLSFDGDVDRLIYYTENHDNSINILNGDKIIVIFLLFFNKLINLFSKGLQEEFRKKVNIGVVTTSYSNGGFMSFVKNLGFSLVIAKTGVKHLHPVAKKFDIGIYFESNGHGTVLYSENLLKNKIPELNCKSGGSKDSQLLELIQVFLQLFNTTCGDSLSNVVSIECALNFLNLSLKDISGYYKELIYLNSTIKVKDKNAFKSNEDDSRLLEPIELQNFIDEVCSRYENSRCFVRASGTEDLVRVYVESKTQDTTEEITQHILKYISENH